MAAGFEISPDGVLNLAAHVDAAAHALEDVRTPIPPMVALDVSGALADVVSVADAQIARAAEELRGHAAAGRRAVAVHEQIDRLLAGQASAQRDRIVP